MSDKNNMVICYEINRFVVFLMVVLRHLVERMDVVGKAFSLGGGTGSGIPDNPNPIVYH